MSNKERKPSECFSVYTREEGVSGALGMFKTDCFLRHYRCRLKLISVDGLSHTVDRTFRGKRILAILLNMACPVLCLHY